MKVIMRYVVSNADNVDIKHLQNNILQARKNAEATLQPFRENIEFHKLLAKASKNQVFVIMLDSIMAVVADFFSRLEPEFEVSVKVIDKHEAILSAIILRDASKATSLLEEHIRDVGKRFHKISDYLTQ